MTTAEKTILDKAYRVNLSIIGWIIAATFITCSTGFGVYYGIKEELHSLKLEIYYLNKRIESLENKK